MEKIPVFGRAGILRKKKKKPRMCAKTRSGYWAVVI
jgi:hypothetical protein